MTSDEPVDGRCNARTSDGNFCTHHPMKNADRCRLHGGKSTGPPAGSDHGDGTDGGAPVDNLNAVTHGLYVDPDIRPGGALDRLREEDDGEGYEFVMSKFESYLERASFDVDTGLADQLLRYCIMEHTIWKAHGVQVRHGLLMRDRRANPGGEPIEHLTEHAINRPLNRLENTVMRGLERLGVMPSPDQQAADAVTEFHKTFMDDLRRDVEVDDEGPIDVEATVEVPDTDTDAESGETETGAGAGAGAASEAGGADGA